MADRGIVVRPHRPSWRRTVQRQADNRSHSADQHVMTRNSSFNQPDPRLDRWWKERVSLLTHQNLALEARALYLEFQEDEEIRNLR